MRAICSVSQDIVDIAVRLRSGDGTVMFSVLSVCLSVHERFFDRTVAEQYHRSDSNQGTDYITY